MAELEYEFTSSGLEDLRDEMQALAEDTEEAGDRAEDAASDLEDMADDGTSAAGDVEESMSGVQEALEDLADEATDTGASLEEGLETDPVDQLDTAVTGLEGEFEQLASTTTEVDLQQIDATPITDIEQRARTARAALADLSGEASAVNVEQIDEGPVVDVGDAAGRATTDLQQMGEGASNASGEITSEMDTAERSVSDVGEEAQEAAQRLQEEFADASDRAIENVTGIQDRLEGLSGLDLDIGGGDITADLAAQLEDVGGSALTGIGITINALQNLATGLNVDSLGDQLEAQRAKRRVAEIAEEVRDLREEVDEAQLNEKLAAGDELSDTEQKLVSLSSDLEEAVSEAKRLGLSLEDLEVEEKDLELGVEAAKDRVSDLADQFRKLKSRFDDFGMEELGSEEFERVSQKLDEVKQKLKDSTRRAAALGAEMRELDVPARMDALELMGLEESVEDAEVNLEQLGEEAQEADSHLDKLGQAIGIEDLTGKLQDAEDALSDFGDEGGGVFTTLASGASSLGSRLTSLVGTTASVATGIGAIGGAAAVAAKQMSDFAAAQAEAAQQMKVAEAQSGVAAKEVQELFLVAERLDSTVDLDAIRDAFKEIALRTEEAREGTGEAREAFERLGISMKELEGLSTAEVFRRVRQEASDLTAQQRALTLEQVAGGEAGERLARVFGLTAHEFNRLKDAVGDDTLTSAQIDELDKLRQEYTAAQQDLRELKQELALTFGPEAVSLLKTFTQAVQDAFDALQGERDTGVLSKAGRPTGGEQQSAAEDPAVQEPTMGEDESVQFGSGSDGEVAEPVQSMREALSRMETRVAVAKEKMSRGLIDKEEMLRQIKRARQAAADELLKLEEQSPNLIPDSEVDDAVRKLRRIKERLEELTSESVSFDIDPEQVQAAGQEPLRGEPSIEAPSSLPSIQGQARAADSIADINALIRTTREQFDLLNNQAAQGFVERLKEARGQMQQQVASGVPQEVSADVSLGSLQSAAEGADSVEDINDLIGATREQFDTLNNEEARDFIGRLQKQREEMKENQDAAAAIGDAMARSVARSADRAFQALGQGVADAIFGGGRGGPGEAQSRLQLFNAKQQVRSLKESLRKGNISYRNFQLKMKAQQAKIQQRQEQLNDSMKSGFEQAADSMLSAFKQMAKQLIAEITAVIAKMAVLKALTAAFDIGSGGFVGSVVSNLGGGAFLDSGAEGGTVRQSGLAIIHKGEEIVPSKTVETLKNLTQADRETPEMPDVEVPDMEMPNVEVPDMDMPDMEMPRPETRMEMATGFSREDVLPSQTVSNPKSLVQPSVPSVEPAGIGDVGMNVTVQVEGETRTDGRDLKTAYDTTTQTQRRKGRK